MEKEQKEWEKKAKCVYVPPCVEVFSAKADSILIGGTHHNAVNDGEFSTAGAKENSNFDIEFKDVWEE